MQFPHSAIFAFNANLDHLKFCSDGDLRKIEQFSPKISSQMNESFSWGVQKETAIDAHECEFFLSNFEFEKKMVGGQAGNAAQQASALGVKCFVHSNTANEELANLFNYPGRIFLAGEKDFSPASSFTSYLKSAHHFVFEHKESRTRFIASYDPFPPHLEDNFCFNIGKELPGIQKAFIGGLHLVKTPDRARKFISELSRWKQANPKMQMFFEMGEFQSREVLLAVEKELFPIIDFLGLNEVESGSLSMELEELASIVPTVLFHSPQEQLVLPQAKLNAAALEFARRCASYKAATGKFATEKDIEGASSDFIDSPVETVGLGDAFSCAYFMSV